MDWIKSMVINHYLHCAGALAAGVAIRHYLDEAILFALRFVPAEKLKSLADQAEAALKSEIDKEAAQPKP